MALFKIRSGFAICLMTGLLLCNGAPIIAAVTPDETSNQEKSVTEKDGVEGFAAYYSKRYNNKRTTSGQRYNPKKLTAAHPSLPLGSKAKVINLANNKEVIVTINDRCRSKSEPFIDLSREAARQLGFLNKRTAEVRIIPLTKETTNDTHTDPQPEPAGSKAGS